MPAIAIDFHQLVSFPARCQNLRTKLGVPQSELARWLGISPAYLSHLEHGRQRPSPQVIHLMEKLETESARHRLTIHTPMPPPPKPAPPTLPPAAVAALDQVRTTPPPASPPRTTLSSTTLAARVKALRDHLGLTRPKLAVVMGVCRQYITKVENGSRASQPFIKLVERMEAELKQQRPSDSAPQRPGFGQISTPSQTPSSRIAVIPLLSQRDTLLLAAPKNASKFAREHFPFSITDPGAFAIRVSGDAMQPLHTDGEIAVVYPDSTPRTGDRVIVRIHDDIGGEVLFRILGGTSGGSQITLCSPNPVYPPLTLDRSQIQWICPVAATIRQLLV
jgi:transcriptional regulator with XRE-family HTH domain